MAIFNSSDQFYRCAEALFERVQQENPDAASSIEENKLLIRFRCSDPETVIMINGRRRPVTFSFGENRIRPEVDISMKVDTLHKILLGDLSLPNALARRKLKVKGPVWKVVPVADLFIQCQAYYPQILKDQGLIF
jgi:putative sterol carrier protein